MTDRIKSLLTRTFDKEQKKFRRDVDWKPLLERFVADGTSDMARARIGLEEMLKAEEPAFMEGERLAFMRTVIRDRLAGAAFAVGRRGGTEFEIVAEPDDVALLAPVFRKKNRPDAVICESDYVAAVLRNTLDKLGLSVPKDVMLAGFDDVRCAVTMFPPLTTVHQPCEDIALVAYRALRERMRDPSLPPRRILVPAPLVVRESTRRTR